MSTRDNKHARHTPPQPGPVVQLEIPAPATAWDDPDNATKRETALHEAAEIVLREHVVVQVVSNDGEVLAEVNRV